MMPITVITLIILWALTACSFIEKTSQHGLQNGFYLLKEGNNKAGHVYLENKEEGISLYEVKDGLVMTNSPMLSFSTGSQDTPGSYQLTRGSLDLDITSILLKYRPAGEGMPPQLNTDFNAALYLGARKDAFRIKASQTPLGKQEIKISQRGFDAGLFAGIGSSAVTPTTTNNLTGLEYNGFILQYGIAAFTETDLVSFGLSLGFDHLTGRDRDVWIYQEKPWIGFIIGIALH
jgi:hypothetical protein